MAPARKFDYDEAQRLHDEGWSYSQLGERFGVSPTAVNRACNPAVRARMDKAASDYFREHYREPCKGGCGRLTWAHKSQERTGLCPQCLGVSRRTAEHGTATRAKRCKCDACRAASAAARRAHRAANREAARAYDRERRRKAKAA